MIKGFDLTCSIGQLLYFPDGLKFALSILNPDEDLPPPVWGVLVTAPSLRDVYNPLDVLPQASFIWSSVLSTMGSRRTLSEDVEMLGFSARTRTRTRTRTRMTVVMNNIQTLLNHRSNERLDTFAGRSEPRSEYSTQAYRRRAAEKERVWACEKIIASGLQPCQIFFEEGARWVWVFPEDVMMP